jgi:prepilin-type N-terminal cleavage/methylation domain-containing protein/prepilin-type processing-associated H-X9-DG protein
LKTEDRHRAGFTLIELLVVVIIITILAALLFPVFATARQQAYQTTCVSNLKQIGVAVHLFMDDHDLGYEGLSDYDDLLYRARPYLRADGVCLCPSNAWISGWVDWLNGITPGDGTIFLDSSISHTSACGGDTRQPIVFNCGENASGHSQAITFKAEAGLSYAQNDDLRFAEGRSPSQTILAGETRLPGPLASALGIDPKYATADATFSLKESKSHEDILPPLPGGGGLLHTHRGRTNWLFLDGHVRSLTVRQTLTPLNMWTARPMDQPAFDGLAKQLLQEYR